MSFIRAGGFLEILIYSINTICLHAANSLAVGKMSPNNNCAHSVQDVSWAFKTVCETTLSSLSLNMSMCFVAVGTLD